MAFPSVPDLWTRMDDSYPSSRTRTCRRVPRRSTPRPERDPGGKTARKWFVALIVLTIVAAAPTLVGQFIYQIRFNEMKADVDVSTAALAGLKPRLTDFELASRMVAKRVEPSVVSIFRPGFRGARRAGLGRDRRRGRLRRHEFSRRRTARDRSRST